MQFGRYIGIDYSGARTPDQSLPGLRVYLADRTTPPLEVHPPPSPRTYWTRREIAWWLADRLSEDTPTLAGIDHAFSFPGLPWLRYLRRRLDNGILFWPFDGWQVPAGRSVLAEIYPSLWNKSFARENRTADQHDAYSVAAWMRQSDQDGSLETFFEPALTPRERTKADIEGWILGVV